ncbi:MAG: hypothetical protein V4629_03225 [Pseudomonadota bacterium]
MKIKFIETHRPTIYTKFTDLEPMELSFNQRVVLEVSAIQGASYMHKEHKKETLEILKKELISLIRSQINKKIKELS